MRSAMFLKTKLSLTLTTEVGVTDSVGGLTEFYILRLALVESHTPFMCLCFLQVKVRLATPRTGGVHKSLREGIS